MDKDRIVLLIDDDEDDMELLHETLRDINHDFHIIQASDGKSGLKILDELVINNTLPCLVVLDLNMPGIDGRQAFMKMKNNDDLTNVPVVIFSTSSSELDKSFFTKYNTPYFVKPVSLEELNKTAKKMLSLCNED